MDYEGLKKAVLSQYSVSPEWCRKGFHAHTWKRDAESNAWIAKGTKLMNLWLRPEERMEQVLNKIAVEQFINSLPQVLRIWVVSHSPNTPTAVAELIESYDSAHSPLGNKVGTRQSDYKPQWKAGSKDSPKQDKGRNEGLPKEQAQRDKASLRDSLLQVQREGTLGSKLHGKNFSCTGEC